MTDQELSEIACRIGLLNITPLHDVVANVRKDIPALIAEVRQLKAEREILAEHVCRAQCWDPTRIGGCLKSLEDCKNCWLEWAREEAGKERT